MGPASRFLGPDVAPVQIWQDPVPAVDHPLIDAADISALKEKVLASGLTVSQLISAAWASAATFRCTDKRGGANGARVRLEPQRNWEVNEPTELAKVLQGLEQIQQDFNMSAPGGKKVSLADLIVLAGCAAVESAAKAGGQTVTVPFHPGRTDAGQEQTDVESFAVLEPKHDGFRNYSQAGDKVPAEVRLVDRANLLGLTAPEMTVLVAGMRVLGANHGQSKHGVLTDRVGTLSNDFLTTLLDADVLWSPSSSEEGVYEGKNMKTGAAVGTGTAADLVFGSNSILRAICESYAQDDAGARFAQDFANAWGKVMHADRYDLIPR
jgi:catalase-peroxidase